MGRLLTKPQDEDASSSAHGAGVELQRPAAWLACDCPSSAASPLRAAQSSLPPVRTPVGDLVQVLRPVRSSEQPSSVTWISRWRYRGSDPQERATEIHLVEILLGGAC